MEILIEGMVKMEYVGWLAPIAFVFALAALAQVGSLKKEIEKLKEKLDD